MEALNLSSVKPVFTANDGYVNPNYEESDQAYEPLSDKPRLTMNDPKAPT